MSETTDRVFIRLKYGYPLTIESYRQMPDELIDKLYRGRFQSTLLTKIEDIPLMREVILDDIFFSTYRCEYWTSSPDIYKNIYDYYENNE